MNLKNVEVKIELFDSFGHLWCFCKNSISGSSISMFKEKATIDCIFPKFPLNKGAYYLSTTIFVQNQLSDEVINAVTISVDHGRYYETGKLPPAHKGFLSDYNWVLKSD